MMALLPKFGAGGGGGGIGFWGAYRGAGSIFRGFLSLFSIFFWCPESHASV